MKEIVWHTTLSPMEVYLTLHTEVVPYGRGLSSDLHFIFINEEKDAFSGEYDERRFILRYLYRPSIIRGLPAVLLEGTYEEAEGGTVITVVRKRTVNEWVGIVVALTALAAALVFGVAGVIVTKSMIVLLNPLLLALAFGFLWCGLVQAGLTWAVRCAIKKLQKILS